MTDLFRIWNGRDFAIIHGLAASEQTGLIMMAQVLLKSGRQLVGQFEKSYS